MELLIQQGSPQWHALRANKIGASDAACILGIGFDSAEKRWKQKVGIEPVIINAAMRRGSTMEEQARKSFECEMGKRFRPAVFVHDQDQHLLASLDGISDKNEILEIKCGNERLHNDAINGIIPPYYNAQLQHQMYVLGQEHAYYYSYNGEKGAIVIVSRDESFLKNYLPKAYDFWVSLQTLTKPESPYMEMDNSAEWKKLAERYLEIQNLKGSLEIEEGRIKIELEALSGGCPARGCGLTLSRATRKGSVDFSKIPQLEGVDLEPFRKPGSEYFRISTERTK